MTFYPRIGEDTFLTLKLVLQKLEEDVGYLGHRECPYSESGKDLLSAMARGQGSVGGAAVGLPEDYDPGDYEAHIHKLLTDMETMGEGLAKLAPNEKISFFKAKTQLVEKLLSMQERNVTLKQMQGFKEVVLDLLDVVCTKDQLADFMTRLDAIGIDK